MKASKTLSIMVAAALAATLAGCGEAVPEVSDANCTPETIAKIEDAQLRADFASKCLRREPGTPAPDPRAGDFQPSKPRSW
jgi:entry exclusion lipoprotein TrbK